MIFINWFTKLWYARLRRIDMNILWPTCKKLSPSLDQAKAIFALHAYNDPAWQYLGESSIYNIIDNLQ